VRFADGSRTRLGFAASNGRPYRGIGRVLMDEGLLTQDEMSMQAIKRVLAQRPELRRRVLGQNPSYVFFRELSPEGGPLGCFETPLTAGRSIATDRKYFPGLAPAFITGSRPGPGGKTLPLARLALNQDTGGAIRGPGRLDLYFGSGAQAGDTAGRMKHVGNMYFLALKR
jgi:membrane-bound lytic murein transglycosylase A